MLPTAGHAVTRLLRSIRKHYEWTGMAKDITEFVKKCGTCQRFKYSLSAMNKFFFDLIDPFPRDERKGWVYAMTMQCELTKEATTVARGFVKKLIPYKKH
jgi:hypothetical protein